MEDQFAVSRSRSFCFRVAAAFTLVELLVVIGIIALLISILLPALNRARKSAVLANCMVNQRSIGQGMQMYANDAKGWLPRDGFGGWRTFTMPLLAPYMGCPAYESYDSLGDIDYVMGYMKPLKLFKCPAIFDPNSEWVVDYIVNSIDFDYFNSTGKYGEMNREPYGIGRVGSMRNPTGTLFSVEVNRSALVPQGIGSFNVWNTGDLPYNTSGIPNTKPRMIAYDDQRHGGWTAAAFFDGHAETLNLKTPGVWNARLINGSRD